jgi:hypothetical protein
MHLVICPAGSSRLIYPSDLAGWKQDAVVSKGSRSIATRQRRRRRATAKRRSVTANSTRRVENRLTDGSGRGLWKNIARTCEVPTVCLPNHHVHTANLTYRSLRSWD